MDDQLVLITGGIGFIGSNLAARLLNNGYRVRILDNMSRAGVEKNLAWLNRLFPTRLEFLRGDVRDFPTVKNAVEDVSIIYHLASQVAVTKSIDDPRTDFEVNALGTLNVLEAARSSIKQPAIVFTSTNKVYGSMEDLSIIEQEKRYALRDFPNGINESRPLDFHSPYGCSKGASDQYVHDYARIYDLPTIVFRMSCIYGTRQFGSEHQGWIAHMIISAIFDKPIHIYGNGKQVRDILWVEDLIDAFQLAILHIDLTHGQCFNIGGGPSNSISIWAELNTLLTDLIQRPLPVTYNDWRPGDQLIYISDTTKLTKTIGWRPTTSKEQGIEKLYQWVKENQDLFGS